MIAVNVRSELNGMKICENVAPKALENKFLHY